MHFGQSDWGGKLTVPQSPHLVVTNLPSLRECQNGCVLEIGTLNRRLSVLRECSVGGSESIFIYPSRAPSRSSSVRSRRRCAPDPSRSGSGLGVCPPPP